MDNIQLEPAQINEIRESLARNEDIAAIRQQMMSMAEGLKPAQVRFANRIIAGVNHIDAYLETVREAKKHVPQRNAAGTTANKWLKHEAIAAYVKKGQELALTATVKKAEYDEHVWMQTQLRIQATALGDVPTKKTIVDDGHAYTVELEETNLAQANKCQELLGKRFGWLQDNINAKMSGRTTLEMRKIDLTGAKTKSKTALLEQFDVDDQAAALDDGK